MSASAVSPAPPVAGPSIPPPGPNKHRANLQKYSHPLPIILPLPISHNKAQRPPPQTFLSSYLPSFFSRPSTLIEVPVCTGTFDPVTRSVWATDAKSKEILFNRGFFGKGTLSRSEPTWRERRVELLKGGESLLAEQIREKRRKERKQFKIDRAAAMLDAAKAAEAVLTAGITPAMSSAGGDPFEQDDMGEVGSVDPSDPLAAELVDGRASPTLSTTTVTTTTTAPGQVDLAKLTPQTFLVRPTRPDANRNRGRKAFRRRPAPASGAAAGPSSAAAVATGAQLTPTNAGPAAQATGVVAQTGGRPPDRSVEEDEEDGGSEIEELVEEMEHLQLGLEEAWFLSAGLGVLRVYDPATETYPPVSSILPLFLTPTASPTVPAITPVDPNARPQGEAGLLPRQTPLLPDDPFLVSYVAYHHYRSLGWVVKPGIKFCADWLLYKRGPAFSHSAFSLIMVPSYADPADRAASPHGNEDWYEERQSWKWINTIMRVNSLVQKTVIMVYITIPSLSSFSSMCKLPDGTLDPRRNDMRGLLEKYQIREVSLTRFGPARRRD